ncbi:MAG TPA: hypothetical protein VH459_11895 [Gaiellales bacterium]|jgi:hypothetical protein
MSDFEHQIDRIVAPLGRISPATRGTGRPVARRHAILGVAVAVLAAAVALGATWAVLDATATPDEDPASPGGALHCVVGGTAENAEQVATAAGYTIQWQLVAYAGDQSFDSETVKSPPADAVVEQAAPGTDGQLVILIHAANDPNAPPPELQPGCPTP